MALFVAVDLAGFMATFARLIGVVFKQGFLGNSSVSRLALSLALATLPTETVPTHLVPFVLRKCGPSLRIRKTSGHPSRRKTHSHAKMYGQGRTRGSCGHLGVSCVILRLTWPTLAQRRRGRSVASLVSFCASTGLICCLR